VTGGRYVNEFHWPLATPGARTCEAGGCARPNHGLTPVVIRVAFAKANHEALEKMGIKNTYYESPNTAHEWQSWRRSLYQFAPLLFQE
jgi:hypothetical protein